jgi:hypothetical protein
MKVFIATKETQGKRKNDFCFCIKNELVKFSSECDREKIDGHCGCKRSMGGFDSLKATTTFKVIDKDMTKEEYYEAFKDSNDKAGWNFSDTQNKMYADELLELADKFSDRIILEKRGNSIQERI